MTERRELNLGLYRRLYLIRTAEKAIRAHYHEDDMKTPMHMSMGEEAIVAGVCQALSATDQVLGSYRSHALYLAKTGDTDGFFAEMYGKATGIAKGKAGSMHLSSPDHGLLCCAAIVASTIPVAVGVAFANKQQANGKVTAVFFGDGALDAGVFWESVNTACLMKLPVLFVCEDNDFAVHTRRRSRHGYASIPKVVSGFECPVLESDTTDAEKVHDLAQKAVKRIRAGRGPVFLYARWYRYLEHVGINEDFHEGYRSKAEFAKWLGKDPVALQRKKLLAKRLADEKQLASLEAAMDEQVAASVAAAKAAPFAEPSELYRDVFA